jgi:DNA-binding response OmpR family regulator
MKILVVEDESLLSELLKVELTDAGHTVLGPATTVSEGLELLATQLPELALVNINLKDGSKGTELATVLMRRWQVPCLFVSGEMLEARQHADVAMGYISKPYDPSTVLESVDVVGAIMSGNEPRHIPQGLKLFEENDNVRQYGHPPITPA